MFLLSCQYGADYCISIFTSNGNFNFMCLRRLADVFNQALFVNTVISKYYVALF